MQTFEENKAEPITIKRNRANLYYSAPYLNECYHCHKKPGVRAFNIEVMSTASIFLYADARGFSVCNLCKEKGLLMQKRKLGKKEKKIFKKMQRELGAFSQVKSITLDAKGNVAP